VENRQARVLGSAIRFEPAVIDLRKFAEGKPCQVRFSMVCNHDPATTVLAHLGVAGFKPKGFTADLRAVHACSDCHNYLDARDLDGFRQALRVRAVADGDFDTDVLQALKRTLEVVGKELDKK